MEFIDWNNLIEIDWQILTEGECCMRKTLCGSGKITEISIIQQVYSEQLIFLLCSADKDESTEISCALKLCTIILQCPEEVVRVFQQQIRYTWSSNNSCLESHNCENFLFSVDIKTWYLLVQTQTLCRISPRNYIFILTLTNRFKNWDVNYRNFGNKMWYFPHWRGQNEVISNIFLKALPWSSIDINKFT